MACWARAEAVGYVSLDEQQKVVMHDSKVSCVVNTSASNWDGSRKWGYAALDKRKWAVIHGGKTSCAAGGARARHTPHCPAYRRRRALHAQAQSDARIGRLSQRHAVHIRTWSNWQPAAASFLPVIPGRAPF